jgi:hypothetical protein
MGTEGDPTGAEVPIIRDIYTPFALERNIETKTLPVYSCQKEVEPLAACAEIIRFL